MTRTKQWKITLIVLCAVLVLSLAAVLLSSFSDKTAFAEPITVSIHNNGNGTVIINDQTLEPDNTTGTIEVTMSEGETLKVKAEAAEGYLFQYWSVEKSVLDGRRPVTKQVSISMKAEDEFSYEEIQQLAEEVKIYANFTQTLPEEEREQNKVTLNYESRLGDVYFFMGDATVSEAQIQRHGLHLEAGEPVEIPYMVDASGRNVQYKAEDSTFAAIPKTSINSTLDSTKTTTAVFKSWTALFSVTYANGTYYEDKIPEICNTSGSISDPSTGSWTPMTHSPIDSIWRMSALSKSANECVGVCPEQKWTSGSGTMWWTNPYDIETQSNKYIYAKNNSITANFQEVACTPAITVTPSVDEQDKDQIELSDTETEAQVKLPYGHKNSVSVLIREHEFDGTQTYHVTLRKLGETESTSITTNPVFDNIIGFSIPEITQNYVITITPVYESATNYFVVPIQIHINLYLDEGIDAVVSPDSEKLEVIDEGEGEWKLDPQFNSPNALAFSSSVSYPSKAVENDTISQLHFKMTGSGVFSFEFYLDGWTGLGRGSGYAVYSLGTPVTSTNVNKENFDAATILAQGGNTSDIGNLVYKPSIIRDEKEVVSLGDNWFAATIKIVSDGETDLYLAHAVGTYIELSEEYYDTLSSHIGMAVRNVAFYQGQSNVTWGVYGDHNDYGTVTAKTGNTNAEQGNIDSGVSVEFDVTVNEGYDFYGWTDGETLLSTETKFNYTVKGKTDGSSETNIYAVLAPKDTPYYFRRGGKFYGENELNKALQDTNKSADVYVLNSFRISQNLEIPNGVNLVIPFDETFRTHGSAGDGDLNAAEISWFGKTYQTPYRTVTIDANVILTVRGGLYLGAVVNNTEHHYQGQTSGAYSQIINNGKIVVDENGLVDIYGRVTGKGEIEVKKDGKLYQPFLILDYSGGSDALGMFQLGNTPFKRYSMVNIEVPITVNYGGTLYGHASLYALSSFFSLDQPFISYDRGGQLGGDGHGHDTFVMLHEGASVRIEYDPNGVVGSATTVNGTAHIGKTKMVFTGGATFSYMIFSAAGFSVPTNSVYFSIPYNFEIEMNGQGAQYETKTDFMIMPGASITVGTGATLTVNANLWILDGFVQGTLHNKSYPTADQLEAANYSKNGNLIVNGTLKIGRKMTVKSFSLDEMFGGSKPFEPKEIGATLLGIVQTSGTGKIEILHEDTILSGKIHDGINGSNYFAHTTTARVWDAAHNCFGELVAGHTYTATGSGEFTLDSLKYTNTKDGDENLTLALGQQLHGSWMVDHSENHNYDWTPVEGEHDGLTGDIKQVKLTRQCTELGCNEHEIKQLLSVPASLGDLVYSGADVTNEQLQGLFNKLFSGVDAEFSSFTARNAQEAPYNVTVTLTNGYWLVGSEYKESTQLSFKVNPKPITVKANDQSSVYGEEHNLDPNGFTVLDDGLCAQDKLSLTLKFQGDAPHDAGDYTIEIADYQGNTNYTITTETGTYKVAQLAITVVLSADARDYNGNEPQVSEIKSSLKQGNLPYSDQLAEIITISFTGKVSKDANSYPFTAALTETGKKNYTLTVEGGNYVINKKSVTVTATDLTSVFGETIQQLTYKVEGLVNDESIDEYIKISTDATNTSPVGNSYTITVTWKDDNRPTNYEVKFRNGHYTITNAQFGNITFSETTVTYDGKTHEPKMNNAPEGATVEYTLNKEPFHGAKDAGTYELTATVKLANYDDSQPYSVTLNIAKLQLTVDLSAVTRSYNGKAPTTEELQATVNGKTVLDTGDNLAEIVTISFKGEVSKNVGDYTAKVTLTQKGEKNYTLKSETESTYRITHEEITIEIQPYSREYDGKDAATDGTLDKLQWSKTSGEWAADEAQPTITFTLTVSSAINADEYDVKGNCSDKNYTVAFTGEAKAVKITPRTLTVTAANKNSTYGDEPVALTYDVSGLVQDDGAIPAISITCEVTKTSGVQVGGYVITVTVTNREQLHNYDVKEVNGVYTVDPRPVTVTIMDQEATYDYQHNYSFVETKWQPDNNVVNGDELEVTLNKPTMTDADAYQITGTYNGTNYTVTFAGSYEGGTAGTYTVHKKQLTDIEDVLYTLLVNGDLFNEQDPQPYTYNGDPLPLTASAILLVDGQGPLSVKVDPAAITESKVYTVTVTIEDTNYEGSKTFTLTVLDAEGYTPNLKNVVDYLEEHYSDLTADNLTAEDFDKVKDIVAKLATLEEEERKSGESKLEQYVKVVNAWNDTEVDESVVATAKAIADAPLKGLMGTIVAMNVLLAAMYVVAKGGLR